MGAVERQTGSLTSAQRLAVEARGNVLVMAGAGTGKTKTLVERCLHCLEHSGAMVDEMLIVTFTEAAAAEMRDRLRKAIEGRLEAEPGENQSPHIGFWSEQLARFDLAHIGTLHSFCLRLVREHFYNLGLDPHLAILEEGEARQLADEILNEQFAAHYAGQDEFSLSVQELIQSHGGGRDEQIRKLILQLHKYSQTRPDASAWLAKQQDKFSQADPVDWLLWLPEVVESWSAEWQAGLDRLHTSNPKAAELLTVLEGLAGLPLDAQWREKATERLAEIIAGESSWPKGRKMELQRPLKGIFDEARFFHSLTIVKNNQDPLTEDWSWIRGQMETLLQLAGEFAGLLATRKNEDGVLDFHDLEQYAIALLWNSETNKPTTVADMWRAKLKFVFVDEYQDINAAQNRIIQGLSRDGVDANRFFVGDVKQSIYRFRLAEPGIFRDYSRSWRGVAGQTIPLLENFRSQKSLLELVNSVCRTVMREEIGGVAYDADAELKPGTAGTQSGNQGEESTGPRAELLIRLKNSREENRGDDGGELAGLDDAEREARLVGLRVKQLVAEKREVFDNVAKVFRPVQWRDVAILLRSPRGRAEVFAKEFEWAGIPLAVARGGFYESAEILDLLSLLQLLDNPLQDVPCVAVLRSPIVSLSLDDLAEIRLAAREKQFWTALNRSAELGLRSAEAQAKIAKFLERFSRWRKLAKLVSLSQCLEEILTETLYLDWLRTQPRGAQRAANVNGFLELAQRFDQFQRQGLFRFLKYVEAQQEAGAEPEVPAEVSENAVRLMSIHQSKGLEFPVVVLADLSKQFNESDLRGEIIFDEEFGLCPKVKPPHAGRRYPSLTNWMAQRRQRRELRGEELRLLYVALTRARDYLILAASVTEKNWKEKWREPQAPSVQVIGSARCFADWLSLWFSNQAAIQKSEKENESAGEFEQLRWRLVANEELESPSTVAESQKTEESVASQKPSIFDEAQMKQLRARLEWEYPFDAATHRKAKSSVTALRREAEILDDEAEMLFPNVEPVPQARRQPGRNSKLSAAEIGAAHHKFLQHFDLNQANDLDSEVNRLVHENYLSTEERAALDVPALSAFWNSKLGREIRAQREYVRRELPFTARFSPLELEQITGAKTEAGLEQEFVVVQGVADLVVLLNKEIWLVDFKTDETSVRELSEKIGIYSPQIKLYASALEKVFAREVKIRALHFLSPRHTEKI